MHEFTTTSRPDRRGRAVLGFTLLEVLLAVVILGLGVLGITAVFAGAASQQLASARQADASSRMDRTAGWMQGRIGAIVTGLGTADPQAPAGGFTSGQYDGLDVPLHPSVWYAMSAYPNVGGLGLHPDNALAIDPSIDPTTQPLQVFMVVDGERDLVLYENPLDTSANNPAPVYPPTNWSIANTVRYVWTGQGDMSQGPEEGSGQAGQNDHQFFDGGAGSDLSLVADLPHSRVHPGTLRLRFDIARKDGDASSARIVSRRSVVFDDRAQFADANNQDIPFDPMLTPADFGLHAGERGRLVFNRNLTPPLPGQQMQPGRIREFEFDLAPYEWIERIVVERYQHRSDVVATLDERLRANGDGTYSGSAILLGRGETGGMRAAAFAYVAEPVARAGEFIPPESGPANQRLLRMLTSAEIALGYDAARRQHYLEVESDSLAWALTPGQVLLLAGDRNDPITTPGADDFAVVARQVREGGSIRGYLNRAPTVSGRPLLVPEIGDVSPRPMAAWIVNPVVQSLAPNGGSWRITPIGGRVIPLR